MNNPTLGPRVRRVRLSLGLSQADLATRVRGSATWVSEVESGRLMPTEEQVSRLHDALKITSAYLLSSDEEPLVSQPLLRAYADAPRQTIKQQIADASVAIEAIERSGLRLLADTIPTWTGDPDDPADIETYAQDVRTAADIADGAVVGNAIRAAERLGCLVLPMPDELGRHLGMSLRVDGTPVMCVSRSTPGSIPGDRQRFTVAHELGHLGLHSHLPPPATAQDAAQLEKQAHAFASSFLAPGDAMLVALERAGGRVTLRALQSIKAEWGIAIKALVMRFKTLGVIDSDHARSLYKQISARGWNKAEPIPVGGERAIWFSRALEKKYGPDGSRRYTVDAGVDQVHFTRWLDWTSSPGADARVLAFPVRT